MITIIIATFFGVIFTLIAVDNSQEVTISLFDASLALPFYVILALTFLMGNIVASIFSLYDWTFTAHDLKKKENSYNNTIKINDELKSNVLKLENENQKLKEEINALNVNYKEKKNQERKESIKNFFHRLTHPRNSSPSHLT